MTIIWQNGEQTVADTDPPTYNFDDYSGTIWINVTNSKQWFGSVAKWTPLDTAMGLTVERTDIDLVDDVNGDGSVLTKSLPHSLSLKKLLHSHHTNIMDNTDDITTLLNTVESNTKKIDNLQNQVEALLTQIRIMQDSNKNI